MVVMDIHKQPNTDSYDLYHNEEFCNFRMMIFKTR